MAKGPVLTDEQRAAIVAALLEGKSQGQIARELGTSQTSVYRVAKAEGIDSVNTRANKAQAALRAQRDYDLGERLNLLNRMFDAAHTLLASDDLTPSKLQQLTMAVAVLIDKRRLEDGDVTSRTEQVSSAGARERVSDRISQLAQRKASIPAPAQPPEQDSPPIPAAAQDATTTEQPDAYVS